MSIIYLFFYCISLSFTRSNFIKCDFTTQLCSLSMFNYINNTSKKILIKKFIRSIKIVLFQKFIYNSRIYLNIIIWTKKIKHRQV